MPFDFHQWLDDAEDLSLPQLVRAAEWGQLTPDAELTGVAAPRWRDGLARSCSPGNSASCSISCGIATSQRPCSRKTGRLTGLSPSVSSPWGSGKPKRSRCSTDHEKNPAIAGGAEFLG